MIKQAQTVGVWIKASERLPDISNTKILNLKISGKKWGTPFLETGRYVGYFIGNSKGTIDSENVEWLSEHQAIILSLDEWEKVKRGIEGLKEIMETVLKHRAFDNEESKVGNHCYNIAQQSIP